MYKRQVEDNAYYFDPDAERFFNPKSMSVEISRDLQERYGVSIDAGDVPRLARIALESLALKYRYTLERLGQICSIPAQRMYIVGGGCQNTLLNQLSANACGIPIYAGIPEASVAGNILCQMYGLGEISGEEEAHALVKNSFRIDEYLPEDAELWQKKYRAFTANVLKI